MSIYNVLQFFISYRVYFTILFIVFEFIFILSKIPVSLKSLNNYFFRRFLYKSLLNRFLVLISYIMRSFNHFSTFSCFPRFSESRFFRVRVQGPGPGFRGTYSQHMQCVQCLSQHIFVEKYSSADDDINFRQDQE